MVIRPLVPSEAAEYILLRREMLADAPWAFAASVEDDLGLDLANVTARVSEPGSAIVGAFDEHAAPGSSGLFGAAGLMLPRQRKMAHRARIWGVYVTPASRRSGAGSAIIRHALQLARTWPGVTSVGLSASVNSTAARAMYQSLGFVPWGIEPGCILLPDGRRFDEVHMVAELAP